MKVSIIILNYKTEKLVRYCVQNIRKSAIRFPHEIIVVNNDSSAALASIRKHLDGVKVIQAETNRGFSAGNNLGIRQASGDYVLIINPDIVVKPGSVEHLVMFLEQRPKAQIVGPQLLNPDQTIQYATYRFPQTYQHILVPFFNRTSLGNLPWAKELLSSYTMVEWDHQNQSAVDWILGASMMVRKTFFDSVKGFDERYFVYGEDMDLCMQAWKSGGEVWYDPSVTMIHYWERSSAKAGWFLGELLNKYAWIHFFSWLKFFWKWRKEIFNKSEVRNPKPETNSNA